MMIVLLFIILSFLAGLYFCANYTHQSVMEYFNDSDRLSIQSCPDVLIQSGSEILLYNKNMPTSPGINPIRFKHLEEYAKFIQWQRSQGIKCPVLFLQKGYNSQGDAVYNVRPSPLELDGGLPPALTTTKSPIESRLLLDSNVDDPPYNSNMYPSFDPINLDVGTITPIDDLFHAKEKWKLSDNPMDSNWGGPHFSEEIVDRDYYVDNYVYKIGNQLPQKP